MRWKAKKPYEPPKLGDRKTERWFAWYPVRAGDTRVWLERVNVTYEFVSRTYDTCEWEGPMTYTRCFWEVQEIELLPKAPLT